MNLATRIIKDSQVGMIWFIMLGILGVILLFCIEFPRSCLRHLGRLTLFLLDYNEHRPDVPRSY